MGPGKQKRETFLKKHPDCCFCGGDKPIAEIDHAVAAQPFQINSEARLFAPYSHRASSDE
jgi:hypothetical protein